MKHSHNGDTIFLELHLNAFTPTIARHFHLDWEYLVKWQKYKKKLTIRLQNDLGRIVTQQWRLDPQYSEEFL